MLFAGYGYVTPQTPAGQILCIFICLLGIPITLLALKSVGDLMAKLVNALVTKFESKLFKRAHPEKVETKSAVILFFLMVIFIVANGRLVMSTQGWTFVESVYFWFVTLTTIGFGDYVPEKRKFHSEQRTRKGFFPYAHDYLCNDWLMCCFKRNQFRHGGYGGIEVPSCLSHVCL